MCNPVGKQQISQLIFSVWNHSRHAKCSKWMPLLIRTSLRTWNPIRLSHWRKLHCPDLARSRDWNHPSLPVPCSSHTPANITTTTMLWFLVNIYCFQLSHFAVIKSHEHRLIRTFWALSSGLSFCAAFSSFCEEKFQTNNQMHVTKNPERRAKVSCNEHKQLTTVDDFSSTSDVNNSAVMAFTFKKTNKTHISLVAKDMNIPKRAEPE